MNILEQIQNVEQKAADAKRMAQADAREFILTCERKAQEAAAQKINIAEEKAVISQNEAVTLAEEKARHFGAESTKKDDVLIEKAQDRLPQAVAYIVRLAEDIA